MTTNLTQAVRQMRIARHNGQISLATQQRTLRRLKHPVAVAQHEAFKAELLSPMPAAWVGMMDLLESIHAEIAPKIAAIRAAEANEFPKCFTVDESAPVKRETPALSADYTLTPEWWKEAGERELAEKKAKLKEAYAK